MNQKDYLEQAFATIDLGSIAWDMHGAKAKIVRKSDKGWAITEPSIGGSLFRPDSIGYCVWKDTENSNFEKRELIADFGNKGYAYACLFYDMVIK